MLKFFKQTGTDELHLVDAILVPSPASHAWRSFDVTCEAPLSYFIRSSRRSTPLLKMFMDQETPKALIAMRLSNSYQSM